MTLLGFVCALLTLPAVVARAAEEIAPPPRPHIVLILAGDLGSSDVSYHGSEIQTPNLDRLVRGGVELDQFYVQSAGAQTRPALLTGRYPIRYGLQDGMLWPWSKGGLPLEERTLPQALGEAGYRTAMLGTWQLGMHAPEKLPLQRGFDRQYGSYTGLIDHFTHRYRDALDWRRDGRALEEEGYATTLVGREAARIVKSHDPSTPLFLFVVFPAPHPPLQAPPRFVEPYASIENERRRTHAGMVAALDEAVGAIVSALEARELTGSTLVVISSENGASLDNGGSNGPLRGGKGQLWEGGVRVPALASWPGTLPAGRVVGQLLHVTDWYPTLLGLAGASLEQPLPLDGRDIWGTLTRGEASPREEILLNVTPRQSAIRVGTWKLVRSFRLVRNELELYNIAADPYEKRDLSRRRIDKVEELQALLDAYAREAAPPQGPFSPHLPLAFPIPTVWSAPE